MKKIIRIIVKTVAILMAAVFLFILIVPVFFKDAIKERVVIEANKRIDATIEFDGYSLSLIRNFPKLDFRLKNLSLVGKDKFEGDTLVAFRSFGFVFDVGSLIGGKAYRLNSLVLDRPVINAIVLEDGSYNWDITGSNESGNAGESEGDKIAEPGAGTQVESEKDTKELNIQLQNIEIRRANVSYTDKNSGISAGLQSMDLGLSGNFSESFTQLKAGLGISGIYFTQEGNKYIDDAVIEADFDIAADLENYIFKLDRNTLSLNDIDFRLDGSVASNDSIIDLDLDFETGETEFNSLLSMIPVFVADVSDVDAEGSIKLDIQVSGIFDSEESILPDINAGLRVNDGSARYAGGEYLVEGLVSEAMFGMKSGKVSGNMAVLASSLNAGEILRLLPEEEDTVDSAGDTLSVSVEKIMLPGNIDFDFNLLIDNFTFNSLQAEDLQSHIALADRQLVIDTTGFRALGGELIIDVLYDTKEIENPFVKAKIAASEIGIKESFENFTTVKRLAPVAEGMDGSASVLFEFSSDLEDNMMPDLNSINGYGRLSSDEIQLINSDLFAKFSKVLKLGDDFSNTLKDVDLEFSVKNGRIYFDPFDTKLGNIGLTMEGDHGLDQTLNYKFTSLIPASSMPGGLNELVSGLAAQASLFGMNIQAPDQYSVIIGMRGTVKDPDFKTSLDMHNTDAKSSVKETVRTRIDEQKGRIMEEAEKQAAMIKEEAAKAARMVRDEAATSAQKLIDEAESKGPLARIAAKKAADILIKEGDKKAALIEKEAADKADEVIEEAYKKLKE